MLKHKKPVLDEREMMEMYRVDHFGMWLMYGLLCAVIVFQLLTGAEMKQMAGELAVVIISSVAMVVQNVRHGIWDETSRPSNKGNAAYSLMAGICVSAVLAVKSGNVITALLVGIGGGALCFAALTALMHYMMLRQAQQEKELDN